MSGVIMVKNEQIKWDTFQLRVSAFPIELINELDLKWWKEITGNEPEERNSRPAQGMTNELGIYNDKSLISSIMSNKIDLIQSITPEMQFVSDSFPTIGKFPETFDTFYPLIEKWLNLLKLFPINRIALGIILLSQVTNREEGYNILNNLLPDINIDSKNSSDFFYQINRPRQSNSGISNLFINRLSKWKVEKRVLVKRPAPEKIITRDESFYCNLELDINTVADYKNEISIDKTPTILKEFIDLGKEISEKGDIK